MKNHNHEDFKIITQIDKRILALPSNRIREGLEYFVNNKLDGIRIAPFFGFNLSSLDFLRDYPEFWKEIKYISISQEITEITALQFLSELRFLLVERKNPALDFSHFPKLEQLIIVGSNRINNLEFCKKLLSLTIWNYSPKTKDFSELPGVSWIEELSIIHSSVINLGGMQKFDKLRKADFHYCAKLEKLCCLENSANTLKFLEFENCKKISNYEYPTTLNNLEILAYNNCGSIPSLQFVNKILTLKSIRFVNTDIRDGDLTPILRLDYAGFSNKRHFSHSFDEVKLLNEKRIGKKRGI